MDTRTKTRETETRHVGEVNLEYEPFHSGTRFRSKAEIEQDANSIRKAHGLTSIPINPVTLANRLGIKVNNAKFSTESLSGLLAKRGNHVTILINQSDSPFRKRFTIAHELGHHFLHLEGDGEILDNEEDLFRTEEHDDDDDRRREVQANQFAAALLMPAEEIRSYYHKGYGLSELARLFNVSESAMGIRLSSLKLV
jgi:Zn-dependent peptidase ImmA (M78 family)